MATQTVTSNAAQHGPVPTPTMPYPPLPASPTLTNPDMILPDYDRTSSPDRSESPLSMWKNAHVADLQYHMSSQNVFPAGPITPTTPIIYGNGTMLSDIGEVTEVESTVGKTSRPTSALLSNRSDSDAAIRSSPTMGYDAAAKPRAKVVSHERRSSIESTSTVTTQDHSGLFADFDDTVSVDDSNFQGDDEESVAESFADDTYSTSSISQRAEEILANAKRRLTTMEGNLSRARSSLYISTSISSDGSTPSPPMLRSAHSLRDASSLPSPTNHSRLLSDSALQDENSSIYTRRSASALGAAGGYRQPLSSSKSVDALSGGLGRPAYKISHHPLGTSLGTLSEDDDSGTESQSRRESAQLDTFLSPTFGSHPELGLTRSASVAQMRDLKVQMKDLKGKISNLREQARADSLKRRSLQSLRTPSPFTNAQVEDWNAESGNAATGRSPWNGELSSVDGDEREAAAEEVARIESVEEDEEEPVLGYGVSGEAETVEVPDGSGDAAVVGADEQQEVLFEEVDIDDMRTEDGDAEEYGDGNAHGSESGDSLYHDTYQTPLSHEDREDAFDYEHFFLHSAMGTISQQRLARSGSFSSESSVETTRGPILANDTKVEEIRPKGHTRRGSGDTTSTMESFETADEGRASRADGEEAGPGEISTGSKRDSEPLSLYSLRSSDEEPRSGMARGRQNSIIHRPLMNSSLHRPSVSSFESTGTNRSFPLVNKAKLNGVLTPQGSPDQELKQISESLMNETASICEKESIYDGENATSMEMLPSEDQLMVQQLVACLGRCVLGLTEAEPDSVEGRIYRRRMEAARRILEGSEGPM